MLCEMEIVIRFNGVPFALFFERIDLLPIGGDTAVVHYSAGSTVDLRWRSGPRGCSSWLTTQRCESVVIEARERAFNARFILCDRNSVRIHADSRICIQRRRVSRLQHSQYCNRTLTICILDRFLREEENAESLLRKVELQLLFTVPRSVNWIDRLSRDGATRREFAKWGDPGVAEWLRVGSRNYAKFVHTRSSSWKSFRTASRQAVPEIMFIQWFPFIKKGRKKRFV